MAVVEGKKLLGWEVSGLFMFTVCEHVCIHIYVCIQNFFLKSQCYCVWAKVKLAPEKIPEKLKSDDAD